jgi:hypothetical protein
MYGGVEIKLYVVIASALDKVERSASSSCFLPSEEIDRISGRVGAGGEDKRSLSLPGIEPQSSSPQLVT